MKRFECTGIGAMKENKTGDWIAYGSLAELLKEVNEIADESKKEIKKYNNDPTFYWGWKSGMKFLKLKLKALEK